MSYQYVIERSYVFTEAGQKQFLSVRDRVKSYLQTAGAVRLDRAIAGETGDSWQMLACVDRLVELGELKELTGPGTAGQHRVFVASYK